jgi:hypothetical protein
MSEFEIRPYARYHLFCEKCDADTTHYLVNMRLWEGGDPDGPPIYVFMCSRCGRLRRIRKE